MNQAANVFYLINKNHPLTNGNKRMSVAVLYIFLAFNRKLVRISQPTMVKLARWVVQTQASHKDVVVNGLEIMIKEALMDIPPEDYRRLMGRG